jgi:hypothetical protein
MNLIVLPRGSFSGVVGANDIGGITTYNVMGFKNFSSGFRVGGGVLYSQFGIDASYNPGILGGEARIYNLRLPTFDLYGNLNAAQWARFFFGVRDVTRSDRRTALGLQLQF